MVSNMAKDPVCGMTVDPQTARWKHSYNGEIVFFCSVQCLEKFRAEPARYLAHAREPHLAHPSAPPAKTNPSHKPAPETAYSCPMHPEIRQLGPGSCPKCGMALEPVSAPSPTEKTEYTCPMHPEIVRSEPGSCPICGMALEPRSITGTGELNPELVDMTRRFWVSLVLTLPVFLLVMSEMIPGQPVQHLLSGRLLMW